MPIDHISPRSVCLMTVVTQTAVLRETRITKAEICARFNILWKVVGELVTCYAK